MVIERENSEGNSVEDPEGNSESNRDPRRQSSEVSDRVENREEKSVGECTRMLEINWRPGSSIIFFSVCRIEIRSTKLTSELRKLDGRCDVRGFDGTMPDSNCHNKKRTHIKQ